MALSMKVPATALDSVLGPCVCPQTYHWDKGQRRKQEFCFRKWMKKYWLSENEEASVFHREGKMGWSPWPLSAHTLLSERNSSRSESLATFTVSVQVTASTWWQRARVGCWLEGEDFLKWTSLACCTIHTFSFHWQLQFHKLECSNLGVDRGDEKRSLWGGRINAETCVKKGESHHVLGEEHSTFRSGRCKVWGGPGVFGARKKASARTTSPRKPHWVSQGPTWSDSLSSLTFCLDIPPWTLHTSHSCLLPYIPDTPGILQPQYSLLASLLGVFFYLYWPAQLSFPFKFLLNFRFLPRPALPPLFTTLSHSLSHQLTHTHPIDFVYFIFFLSLGFF